MRSNGSPEFRISQIDVSDIKFFVRRHRASGPYSRLKDSIREIGLKIPISVRDISDWSRSDRRRPDGGLYKFELIYGQGRLQAFRELGIEHIPAVVCDIAEAEIVGRFLAENVMRKRLSWVERAQLIQFDVEEGLSVEEIARKYFITQNHALKYLRILRAAASEVIAEAQLNDLSMNDAELLTTLSRDNQNIVVEVLKEEGLSLDSLEPLVRLVQEKAKVNGKFSKSDLKAEITNLRKDRRNSRNALKLYRRLDACGPGNLRRLLQIPEFRMALDGLSISYEAIHTVP